MAITRIIKKLSNDIANLAKCYGYRYAFYNLVWWLNFYVRTPLTLKLTTWAQDHITQWLDKFLEKNYPDKVEEVKKTTLSQPVSDYKIWIFWGQGESTMPTLVRICYERWKRYHPDNVVLVTFDNLSQYIELPDALLQKVKAGKQTWASFSDIVRTTLLAKHGGLWSDATVFAPKPLPIEKLKSMPFYAANYPNKLTNRSVRFWTSYQWNINAWFMGSGFAHQKVFTWVSDIMTRVAVDFKLWPHYVFVDYVINYMLRNDESFRKDVEAIDIHNPYRNRLSEIMGQPYDEENYKKMLDSELIFKLSFRAEWPTEVDGKVTYYGKFIKGEL